MLPLYQPPGATALDPGQSGTAARARPAGRAAVGEPVAGKATSRTAANGGAAAGRSDQDWDRAPIRAGVVAAPQLWAGIVVFACGDASQPKGFGRWGALAYYAVFGAWSSCFVARTPEVPRDNREEHVVKRFGSLVVVSSVVAACVVGLVGVAGASAVSTLPTLNVAVDWQDGHRGVR